MRTLTNIPGVLLISVSEVVQTLQIFKPTSVSLAGCSASL